MVISKTIMSHATCRWATLGLARAGVGLLAGDAERRLGLGDRGVAGDLGLLDGLVGLLDGLVNRLVVELARRVLELAALAKVARLGDELGGAVQEGALVAVLARAGLGEELARHGAVVGRLVRLGRVLVVAHGREAVVVRLVDGVNLEDGRRVVDGGAAVHLLQVQDELVLARVLDAAVGQLPAEVLERRLDGAALDDGALLAVLGLDRLGLDDGRLRHARPQRLGNLGYRADDLQHQLLLLRVKVVLVVVGDKLLDDVVDDRVEVNVQLRVLDVADELAEPAARRVGVGRNGLVDNHRGKGLRHLHKNRLANLGDVARRLRHLVLDDDRVIEHALGDLLGDRLVDVALDGRHVGMGCDELKA